MSKLTDIISKLFYGSSAQLVVETIDTKIKVFLDSRSDAELAKLVDELFWEGPQRNGDIFDEVSKDERVRKCISERNSRYGDRSKAEADVFGNPGSDFNSRGEQVKSSAAGSKTEFWNFDKWGDEDDTFSEPDDVDNPIIDDPFSQSKVKQFSILSELKAVAYPAEPNTDANDDLVQEEATEQNRDKAPAFETYDAAAIRDFMSKNSFDEFRNDRSVEFVLENLEAVQSQAPTVSELLNPLFEDDVEPAIQKSEKIGVDPRRDFDDFNFEDVQWDVSDIVNPESLNRDRVSRTSGGSGPKVETFPDPKHPVGRLVDPSDDTNGFDEFVFEEPNFDSMPDFHDVKPVEADEIKDGLFWTMATDMPFLWMAEDDLGPKETQAIRLFLFRLAKCVEHRGLLLNADSFQRMAEHLKPGKVHTMLSEPWLSYRKLDGEHARELAVETCKQMFPIISFEKIGLPDGFVTDQADLLSRLAWGNSEDYAVMSNALRGYHSSMGDTFATTFDYVAACLGDREAMARVAVYIDDYLEGDSAKLLLGYLVHDLTIIANNWWRLHFATPRTEQNIEDIFNSKFRDANLDLRDIAAENKLKLEEALVLRLPSDKAKAAMEASNAMRSRGVPADWDNDFIKGDDKRPPSGTKVETHISMSSLERGSKCKNVMVLDKITAPDSDIEKSYGNLRQSFPIIEAYDADEIFLALNKEFPWMEELNEFVARSVAMAERNDSGFVFKPILLCGTAGVGKSRWARKVSEVTTVPMHRANLSGLSSSKSIVGSERGWTSARPSLPALAFSTLEVANPIIFVDEVEKAGVGANGDAVSGLLPMLEHETAHKYPDPFLLGNLDLTRISWIFTANSVGGLHQEFLDRVKLFNVEKPSHKDHRLIVDGLVKDATRKFNFEKEGFWEGVEALRDEAMNAMGSGRSIRAVKDLIEDGVAKLVWKKPSHLRIVK